MNMNCYNKRATCLFILFFGYQMAIAQDLRDTTYWTTNGQASLNFSQVALSNWVGGGNSSAAGIGRIDFNADYERGRTKWENSLKTGYGLMREGGGQVVKNEDKLELNSKYGLQLNIENLLYSTYLNFSTQFAPGYRYPNTTNRISDFLAPGFILSISEE